jgi:glycosyltransferase involved in cell wall biosynthesis
MGGVYLDAKSTIDMPLRDTLLADDAYLLSHWRNGLGEPYEGWGMYSECGPRGEFQQWHVIAEPKHPFLKSVIEKVLSNIESYSAHPYNIGKIGVLRMTGPIAYTTAINDIKEQHPHRLVDIENLGFRYSIAKNPTDDVEHRSFQSGLYTNLTAPLILRPAHVVDQTDHCLTETHFSVKPQISGIYFDITDIVVHFCHSRTPTGIQRVQIELIRSAFDRGTKIPIFVCAYYDDLRCWVRIARDDILNLLETSNRPGQFLDDEWFLALFQLMLNYDPRNECVFPPMSVLINLGVIWEKGPYLGSVKMAKYRFGVRFVPMVYDLIPTSLPQFAYPGSPLVFNRWISHILSLADQIIGISSHTLCDLSDAASRTDPLKFYPITMPLEGSIVENQRLHNQTEALKRFDLKPNSYILFVSTLEIRKSHLIAFKAWLRIIDEHGSDNVPKLVCIGRIGWNFETTLEFYNQHPALKEKILLITGLSDSEVGAAYQNCLFTIYPSLYEGWGLPVTESLCYGKPCLTADNSSLPEAGGKFADYFETDSIESFTGAVSKLIFDHEYRESRRLLIETEFRPRPWGEILMTLVENLMGRFRIGPVTGFWNTISFGQIYRFTHNPFYTALDKNAAFAEMLCFEFGWHQIGNDGVWSKQREAKLAFFIPSEVTSDLSVYVTAMSNQQDAALTIKVGNQNFQHSLGQWSQKLLVLRLPQSEVMQLYRQKQPVIISFEVDRLNISNEGQSGIGLKHFMVCEYNDLHARLEFNEKLFHNQCFG